MAKQISETSQASGHASRVLNEQFYAILGPELLSRRKYQDEQHGGPDHDDTHSPEDWVRFIQDYAYRARIAATTVDDLIEGSRLTVDHDAYEDRMFDVAALAIAAIQSSRRRRYRPIFGEGWDGDDPR
jgi:hypothetical protein